MSAVYARLLASADLPAPIADLASFLARARASAPAERGSVERAALAGNIADRLGYAFAGGYLEALSRAFRGAGPRACLCATESGGGHPRAIATRLSARADGSFELRGTKTFATLAPVADTLFVAATVGTHAPDVPGGKPRNALRVARVRRERAGIAIEPLAPTPFAPEIPHAIVHLEGVVVAPDEVLEGDGYAAYLKPFRTVEDVHVLAATIGHLAAHARALAFPRAAVERLLAALGALIAVDAAPPLDPGVHLALAAAIASVHATLAEIEPCWSAAPADVRARWRRDVPLLAVADRARAARTSAAWAAMGAERPEAPAST